MLAKSGLNHAHKWQTVNVGSLVLLISVTVFV
jgi:hypothetical protein